MNARTYERLKDSRGRPVVGLYKRDGKIVAGASIKGRWTLKTLEATRLTEARRERSAWLAALREGRVAERNGSTFEEVFSTGRRAAPSAADESP